jgi:hypothetical protein
MLLRFSASSSHTEELVTEILKTLFWKQALPYDMNRRCTFEVYFCELFAIPTKCLQYRDVVPIIFRLKQINMHLNLRWPKMHSNSILSIGVTSSMASEQRT